MTILHLLLIPIVATTIYMLGDLLACAGIRRGSKALHRIGCLLVAVAAAMLALLWVELCGLRG